MSKWDLPRRRKPKPLPPPSTEEIIICRVVPPRLARISGIADWLYSSRYAKTTKVSRDKVWALIQRYKELRQLGFDGEDL